MIPFKFMSRSVEETILEELSLTDVLAVERTHLAIERTFLSYFRTAVVFASAGFTILKVTSLHTQIMELGIILLAMSPIILFVGIWRFVIAYKKVKQHYRRFVKHFTESKA
jgi:putative membrane protein